MIDINVKEHIDGKRIYIYGAAVFGRIMAEYLIENGMDFEGFLVSDTKGRRVEVFDKSVISLKDLSISKELIVLVCVDESIKKDIVCRLNEVGVEDYITFANGDFDTIEKSLEYNLNRNYSRCIYVLIYHRVGMYSNDPWKLSISEKLFSEQLDYLKNNYPILRFEDDWNSIEKDSVVITFDDGYSDFYHKALPILKKHNIPATVFVSTGNMDSANEFWWDELERIFYSTDKKQILYKNHSYDISSGDKVEKVLYELHPYLKGLAGTRRKEEIETLKGMLGDCDVRNDYRSLSSEELMALSNEKLITIGAHTVSHPCMAAESIENQSHELVESKKFIEKTINRPISLFAYPFGGRSDFSPDTLRVALSCGFTKVAAAMPGVVDEKYVNGYIPRINIAQESNLSDSIRCLRKVKCLYYDEFV